MTLNVRAIKGEWEKFYKRYLKNILNLIINFPFLVFKLPIKR